MLDKLKNQSNGPVIASARVQVIFWGTDWNAMAQQQDAMQLINDLTQLCSGPYMRGLSQYGVSPATILTPPIFDNATSPPATISTTTISTYLQGAIGTNGILDFRNDGQLLYLVVTLNRDWFQPNIAGFHNWGELTKQNFHWAWISSASSVFASHELIEACTDPEGASWLQPENGIEVGDICEDSGFSGNTDGVDAAIYWSNVDGLCILPHRVAKIKVAADSMDSCVGPHLGGKTRFSAQINVEPSWIDATGLSLTNVQYSWNFNSGIATPVGPVNGPNLELQWTNGGTNQVVSVTVTAAGGISMTTQVTIKKILTTQETEFAEKMCALRRYIATIALLPPPVPDPEGPIISTILPTPSELLRLRAMISRMSATLDSAIQLSRRLPLASGRMDIRDRGH